MPNATINYKYVVRKCDDRDLVEKNKGWSWDVVELPRDVVVETHPTRIAARHAAKRLLSKNPQWVHAPK